MTPDPSDNQAGAPTSVRWIVLAMVAFAAASAYLTRYCISAANTTIQKDLGFSDAQIGQLMSAFALGYLLCQIPSGWLGNRLGTRLAFPFLSLLWSLCNVGSAVGSALNVLLVSRFSLGVFQAGLVPISAKILSDWMPLSVRGFSSASITASMSIGGVFAMWLTGRLLDQGYGWRMIFATYSTVGIGWAIGFYWYFRTLPRDHKGVNAAELRLIDDADASDEDAIAGTESEVARSEDEAQATQRQNLYTAPASATGRKVPLKSSELLLTKLLTSVAMWGICVQEFFSAAGYVFFVTWFFAFLEYAYGINKAQAGMLNSLPLVAVVVGSLSGGVIVDWLMMTTGSRSLSRKGIAIVALTLSGSLTLASAWTSSATQFSVIIAFGALFSGIAKPAMWAATIDIGGRHTAVVMGAVNMAGCLAGVILPILLGSWFSQIRDTGGDWNLVIYLHAAFYFVGALSWLAVNPNRQV